MQDTPLMSMVPALHPCWDLFMQAETFRNEVCEIAERAPARDEKTKRFTIVFLDLLYVYRKLVDLERGQHAERQTTSYIDTQGSTAALQSKKRAGVILLEACQVVLTPAEFNFISARQLARQTLEEVAKENRKSVGWAHAEEKRILGKLRKKFAAEGLTREMFQSRQTIHKNEPQSRPQDLQEEMQQSFEAGHSKLPQEEEGDHTPPTTDADPENDHSL